MIGISVWFMEESSKKIEVSKKVQERRNNGNSFEEYFTWMILHFPSSIIKYWMNKSILVVDKCNNINRSSINIIVEIKYGF